jgi:hypothetical protein
MPPARPPGPAACTGLPQRWGGSPRAWKGATAGGLARASYTASGLDFGPFEALTSVRGLGNRIFCGEMAVIWTRKIGGRQLLRGSTTMNVPTCEVPVLTMFRPAFSTPTYRRFMILVLAAVLTTGRRTVTNQLRTA